MSKLRQFVIHRVGQNVTIVLIGCMNGTVTRGEGVQKSENFADVIYRVTILDGYNLLLT